MAFTRKLIRDIISKLTAGGDYTAENAVDDILAEHGATIKLFKDKLTDYEDIDIDTYRADKDKYDALTAKLGDRQLDDVLTENDNLKKQISDSAREKLVDDVVKDFKFKDKYAESAVREEIRSWAIADDGSSFVDAEAKIAKLKEDFSDAFASEDNAPRRIAVSKGTAANSDPARAASAAYLEQRKRDLGLIK